MVYHIRAFLLVSPFLKIDIESQPRCAIVPNDFRTIILEIPLVMWLGLNSVRRIRKYVNKG